jgi:hypothetical protein
MLVETGRGVLLRTRSNLSEEFSVRKAFHLGALLTFCTLAASSAQATVILSDRFDYANGPISTVSNPLWTIHSGTDSGATALNIASGQAIINQGDTHGSGADANRLLSTTFNPVTDNTSVIYSGFTVNFSSLPVNGDSDGSYFAHFKSSTANEFYGRIGANTNGAAAGTFRLSVANEVWNTTLSNTVEFPLDLALNTTYTVVSRLDLATDRTTLWVNPVSESSLSVSATDAFSYSGLINAYALRQGTSGTGAPGILAVDNVWVATTFAEVVGVPEASSVAFAGLACCASGLTYFVRRRWMA